MAKAKPKTKTLHPIPPAKKPELTQDQIFQKLEEEWDFEKLLEPYREGGTKSDPVRRTWGTVIDWLVNKRKFPPDIVGAAIFLVWMKIKRDGHFKGDDSYGSAGNEFVQTIRIMCASLMQQQMSKKIFSGMAGEIENKIKAAIKADFFYLTPWFVKMFSVKYWRHKNQVRKIKKNG
jgi:hypothetical protein